MKQFRIRSLPVKPPPAISSSKDLCQPVAYQRAEGISAREAAETWLVLRANANAFGTAPISFLIQIFEEPIGSELANVETFHLWRPGLLN